MKQVISSIIKKALKKIKVNIPEDEIEKLIEIPPSTEMGDYAFPCFSLAGKLKQDPKDIAINLREEIGTIEVFEDIQTAGPYINFFVNRKTLALKLIKEILDKKENFGRFPMNNKSVMVEFPSPNTNKPLHLGHLRNMSLGESISRIFELNGFSVIRANLNNDRGIHICKSMAAYKFYGKNKSPGKGKKTDHFVGDFYVLFAQKEKENEKMELESHRMLQNWESGDKETLELWKKMNKWALDGFRETYRKFEIKHDKEYFESDIYKFGRDIILNGLKKGIFKKNSEGAIIADLKKEGLGEKVLLRSDGTSVYITQDIYLAKLKFDNYKLSNSVYVVGNEQEFHFNVLFAILKKLKFPFADNLKHLSYGMVFLPEGKMKSREGTVVDADDLIEQVQNLVKKELSSRYKLPKKETESRSLKITLAAIKYFLLKRDIKKNMIFNPKESINFEGDTGPYLLYSYARAKSILKKAKPKKQELDLGELEPKEIELIKKISQFKEITENAYKNLNPSLIANYSYQLAQIFNEFYHDCPVIGSDKEKFRLMLVDAFANVLKNSLNLLGIETLEKM